MSTAYAIMFLVFIATFVSAGFTLASLARVYHRRARRDVTSARGQQQHAP